MTSATLYREGLDLDELLAALDDEHPGRVRVVEVSYPREGGVFGFFARQKVGVHYRLDEAAEPAVGPAVERSVERAAGPSVEPVTDHPLAALIAAAEAADGTGDRAETGAGVEEGAGTTPEVPPAATPEAAPTNAEFAQMLLELAARKAGGRPAASVPGPPAPHVTAPAAAGDQTPWIYARPAAAATPAPPPGVPAAAPAAAPAAPPAAARERADGDSRARLTLRRRLAEVGVPIDWVPADGGDAYRVVEQLVHRLPAAPEPPTGPGDLIVIAGPAGAALRAAETLRATLRLRPENVWGAGCPAGAVADGLTIDDAWHAATVAAEVRLAGRGPTIVVVATDDDGADDRGHERWAAGVVRALQPEALWAVVDATRKPSDTRARLRTLGAPTALVVTSAARTASPASVWELGVPTALLDGRPATPGSWAVLLIDRLSEPEL